MNNSHSPQHEDDHEEASEGWLVSYADMMTLLFGLFVMLYSMAIENQGTMDQQLKEVSTSLSEANQKNILEKPVPVIDPKVEIVTVKEENKILKEDRDKQIQLAESIKKENDEMKLKLDEFEKAKDQMQSQLIDHEVEKEKIKKELERMIASKPLETVVQKKVEAPPVDPKITQEALTKLKQQLAEETKTADDLKVELDKAKAELNSAPKFLMFVLKWFTEKHDLDLTLYDPTGKKYNFKKRDYPNHPGRLALDSRSGPGAEIWQTNEFLAGEYRLVVNFYQEYGNTENTKFVIEVSSAKTTFATKQIEMAFTEKNKEFKFQVDSKGVVHLR